MGNMAQQKHKNDREQNFRANHESENSKSQGDGPDDASNTTLFLAFLIKAELPRFWGQSFLLSCEARENRQERPV